MTVKNVMSFSLIVCVSLNSESYLLQRRMRDRDRDRLQDLPDDVIYNWLSNLNPTYETLDWSRKWLANFIVGKTQLVSFDRFSNSVTNDVIIDRYVLEEKSFKMLGMFFFLNWIRALTLSLLLRLLPKKLDTR